MSKWGEPLRFVFVKDSFIISSHTYHKLTLRTTPANKNLCYDKIYIFINVARKMLFSYIPMLFQVFMFYETLLSMGGTQEYKLKWKNTF